jgi:nucleoside-diphosphate-sugar epimerase
VYNDGTHTRSFCYVSDLVEGIVRLLDSGESTPVNLGNPDEMSILDLAKEVLRLTGSKSTVKFVVPTDARTADDPQVRCPDISKASALLDWKPVVSLETGLKRTIGYFRERN